MTLFEAKRRFYWFNELADILRDTPLRNINTIFAIGVKHIQQQRHQLQSCIRYKQHNNISMLGWIMVPPHGLEPWTH